jgi:hypothetical protein
MFNKYIVQITLFKKKTPNPWILANKSSIFHPEI